MIRIFYNVLMMLLSPIWLIWMVYRARKRQQLPNWSERWGKYSISPDDSRKRIWLHAVSVGEVMAAKPILKELRALLPDVKIVVTCTTSTGYGIARSLLGMEADYLFYFPLDIPIACKRAMASVSPSVVVIMETELWLNFVWAAKKFLAKVCVANGRMSEKSFRKASRISFYYRSVFSYIDACFVQTEEDGERFRRLGGKNIQVLGNSKYDEASKIETKRDWRKEIRLNPSERWVVVGSARGEFEENFILEALRGIEARILFAPRHIERTGEILNKAMKMGFQVGRRSRGENDAQFLVLDTLGELSSTYGHADLAIIGGGFDKLGGQNIIQPMAAGCPVVCGPNMENFREAFEEGLKSGALKVAHTSSELREIVTTLLEDAKLREQMGIQGKTLVERNRNAAKRYALAIAELVSVYDQETEKDYLSIGALKDLG